MAKNNKKVEVAEEQTSQPEEEVVAPEEVAAPEQEVVEEKVEPKKDSKKVDNKKKDNKKKDKAPSKRGKRIKETISELKKVTWPTFGSVVKKTGIVLAVVVIFAVVLFGIDRLLAWLFDLLTNQVV